jgi:hypothetical protein
MNVPFSLLLAAEGAIHPGTVAAGKEVYPDIARKSVGHPFTACQGMAPGQGKALERRVDSRN